MASDVFLSWANRTVLRPGREEPYLSIQDIVVFVRDLELSKRFYLQQLRFELITEQRLPTGERWIEVAPAGAQTTIALVPPREGEPVGIQMRVGYSSDDVDADHDALAARGVDVDDVMRMGDPVPPMLFFRDQDGNTFMIAQSG